MTIEEMQQRKRELGLTYEEIAERCELSVPTVQRIISGTTQNPREYTRRQIEAVLSDEKCGTVLRELAFTYMTKKQGDYTAEDYYALPDDQRCELIDGVIYDLASPTAVHQIITLELGIQLDGYVKKNGGKCLVFVAPFDVDLDKRTVVQPDVMVFCSSEGKGKDQNEIPDLAIEVTSPSTRSRDYILKLSKYMASGMSEYWVVDPQKERITVYLFEEEVITKHYGLYDKIPVSIWDGKCVVDLSAAKRKISLSEELKAETDFEDETEEAGGVEVDTDPES
jgi:Uma2 family endonuclease